MAEPPRPGAGRVKGVFSLDAAGSRPIQPAGGRRTAVVPRREFQWREVPEGAVRTVVVMVLLPGGQLPRSFRHATEDLHVQALISKSAIEALDGAVLRGFPGVDEGQLDLMKVGLGIHNLAGKLATIVHDNGYRLAALPDCPIQDFGDIRLGEPWFGMQGQALPGELVLDGHPGERG